MTKTFFASTEQTKILGGAHSLGLSISSLKRSIKITSDFVLTQISPASEQFNVANVIHKNDVNS